MINKEYGVTPLKVRGGNHLRSVGAQNGIHCLSEKTSIGEPVSRLKSHERHEYYTLLTEYCGVLDLDARKAVKRMRSSANASLESDAQGHQNPGAVRTVLQEFAGLIGMRRETQAGNQNANLGEPIPVGKEVTVFRRG